MTGRTSLRWLDGAQLKAPYGPPSQWRRLSHSTGTTARMVKGGCRPHQTNMTLPSAAVSRPSRPGLCGGTPRLCPTEQPHDSN